MLYIFKYIQEIFDFSKIRKIKSKITELWFDHLSYSARIINRQFLIYPQSFDFFKNSNHKLRMYVNLRTLRHVNFVIYLFP